MPPPPSLLPGDLIFHESKSDQAKAIKEITESRYTHCGIIVERDGDLYVAEAINPVRVIGTSEHPLASVKSWIDRGIDDHAIIKKIHGGLSREQIQLLEVEMRESDGKEYDGRFQWNDNAIYCSEFIYDSFNKALQIILGEVQTFGEFPLDGPLARELIETRYTRMNIPFSLEEQIITPVSVMNDPKLEPVLTVDHGRVQDA
jgi:hypothetical protein